METPFTLPAPLAPLWDTHCHLDQPEFDDDREAVVERCREVGVTGLLCVGIDARSSAAAVALAERHDFVYAAVGIQPNYAAQAEPDDWERIVTLAEHPRVRAIGETGLDRYWDFTPFDVQLDFFQRHLALARQRGLAFLVHSRDCDAEMLAALRAERARGELRGLMHAFSSDAAVAAQCLEMGLFISFAGNVSYTNKKFAPLREAAAAVPADRLLLETDSPYIVPQPLRGRLKRNEPALVVHTARALAELRGLPAEALAAQTTANARRLFQG